MKRVFIHEHASGWHEPLPASIVAEGRAMRDALCRDLAATGGCAILASAAGVPPPDGTVRFDPRPEESLDEFLGRAAEQADFVWPIAPESAGTALSIACALEAAGVTTVGPAPGAIALASSKSRTLKRLAAHGIETALTCPLQSAPFERYPRWAIKPDCGCGCEGVVRLDAAAAADWREAQHALARREPLIAQPWIDGEAASLSVLATAKVVEVLSVNRQHLDIDAYGKVSLARLSRRAEAPSAAMRKLADKVVAAIPGLRGYFGIDFILRADGSCVAVEVNPRLTSSYVGLSAHLGRNIGGEILAAAMAEGCLA